MKTPSVNMDDEVLIIRRYRSKQVLHQPKTINESYVYKKYFLFYSKITMEYYYGHCLQLYHVVPGL